MTMRGPAQFANIALDQLREQDGTTGEREHTDLVSSTMAINCMSKVGLEAQRIAWIVMRFLRTFKRLLQRTGGFHQVGERVTVGPETPPGALVAPEADSELVNVIVHSPFFFQWTERVTPTNAQLVQSIEASIVANVYPPLEEPGAELTKRWEQDIRLKQPSIRGVPIKGDPVAIGTPLTATVKT